MTRQRARLQYVPRRASAPPIADDALATMIASPAGSGPNACAADDDDDREPATLIAVGRTSAPRLVDHNSDHAVAADAYDDDDADERTLIANESAPDSDAASTVMWARSPAGGVAAAPPAAPSRPRSSIPAAAPVRSRAPSQPDLGRAPSPLAPNPLIRRSPAQFQPQPLPARAPVVAQRKSSPAMQRPSTPPPMPVQTIPQQQMPQQMQRPMTPPQPMPQMPPSMPQLPQQMQLQHEQVPQTSSPFGATILGAPRATYVPPAPYAQAMQMPVPMQRPMTPPQPMPVAQYAPPQPMPVAQYSPPPQMHHPSVSSIAPIAMDPRVQSQPPMPSQSPFAYTTNPQQPNGQPGQPQAQIKNSEGVDVGGTIAKLAAVLIFAAIGIFLLRPMAAEDPVLTPATASAAPQQPAAVVPQVVQVTPPARAIASSDPQVAQQVQAPAGQQVVAVPVVDASAAPVTSAPVTVTRPVVRKKKAAKKQDEASSAQDALQQAQQETSGSLN